jgi:hypothetical protein
MGPRVADAPGGSGRNRIPKQILTLIGPNLTIFHRLSKCKEILNMTGKSLLTLGALALATVGLASAKSYDIDLLATAKAGTVELKPGEYKLKVEGAQAVFTDVQSGKSFSVPAKVENSDQKFSNTRIESANQNGMDTIQAIDLAGSGTRINLQQ